MSTWDDFVATPSDNDLVLFRVPSEPALDFDAEAYAVAVIGDAPRKVEKPVHEFFGELENRRLEVSNYDPRVTTAELLRATASEFGDVVSVELSLGKAFVTFFDLRAAHKMRTASIVLGRCAWLIQFAILEKVVRQAVIPNNGTIVVFNLKKNVTTEQVESEFAKFGAIREIRETSERGMQKFIEYWDLRHCEAALNATNGRRILGSTVRVEFSLPRGIRKNPEIFKENRLPTVSRSVKPTALQITKASTDRAAFA
jgi:hypothetical protein